MKNWSTKAKVFLALGLYLGITIVLIAILGNEGKNEEFQPQNEFKLEPWIEIDIAGIDFSINKAVFYLFLASALTMGTMTWIARRMQQKPNKVQMLVELAYDLTAKNITAGNLGEGTKMAKRWFPMLASLFFFIWFSNMIGFLPLPINTEHKVDVLGLEVPSFALYAATANLSIPLVLTLIVWISYHVEGIRAKGFFPYLASWLPAGLEDMNPAVQGVHLRDRGDLPLRPPDLALGTALRQHPRRPPAAPVHGRRPRRAARPGGARRPHLPARVLLLHPGGRPDRHPPGVHLLDPYGHLPRRRDRRESLSKGASMDLLIPLAQSTEVVTDVGVTDAGKAIALGVGAGLGSIGAGIGIGIIFGKEIESVARQPEMRDELQAIRWLGFALTEAVAFYTFIFGLIAFFL